VKQFYVVIVVLLSNIIEVMVILLAQMSANTRV